MHTLIQHFFFYKRKTYSICKWFCITLAVVRKINVSPTNGEADGTCGFPVSCYNCIHLKSSHVCVIQPDVKGYHYQHSCENTGWMALPRKRNCLHNMCVGGKFFPWLLHNSTTSNLPKLRIRSLSWLHFSHTYTETCWIRKPFLTSFTASSKAFFTADPSHLLIFTGLSLSWKNENNILNTDETHIKITVYRNVTPCNIRAHWFTTTSFGSIRTSLKH